MVWNDFKNMDSKVKRALCETTKWNGLNIEGTLKS